MAYAATGQLENFSPMDFIPHWLKGDLILKDDEAKDKHIQLKQTGGHFRVGLTGKYYEKSVKNAKVSLTGKEAYTISYAQARALKSGSILVEKFYNTYVKDKKPIKDPKQYAIVMRKYADSTKSDYIIINFTGITPAYNYSITIKREQLAVFAAQNTDLFYMSFGGKGDGKPGYPAYCELTIRDPKSISELAKLRFSSGGIFLHSYDENLYYRKIGSRRSKTRAKQAAAEVYIEKTVSPRWKEFITIHEQLFGPLEYRLD
jgi:hypothetical protein